MYPKEYPWNQQVLSIGILGLFAIFIVIGLGPTVPLLQTEQLFAAEIQLEDLNRQPDRYMDQRITVKGHLKYTGKNYFGDPSPQFVLEDTAHNQVQVTPWLPLEVAPLPPDQLNRSGQQPKTMYDYLGKELRITGKVRFNKHKAKHEVESELVEETQPQEP